MYRHKGIQMRAINGPPTVNRQATNQSMNVTNKPDSNQPQTTIKHHYDKNQPTANQADKHTKHDLPTNRQPINRPPSPNQLTGHQRTTHTHNSPKKTIGIIIIIILQHRQQTAVAAAAVEVGCWNELVLPVRPHPLPCHFETWSIKVECFRDYVGRETLSLPKSN